MHQDSDWKAQDKAEEGDIKRDEKGIKKDAQISRLKEFDIAVQMETKRGYALVEPAEAQHQKDNQWRGKGNEIKNKGGKQ